MDWHLFGQSIRVRGLNKKQKPWLVFLLLTKPLTRPYGPPSPRKGERERCRFFFFQPPTPNRQISEHHQVVVQYVCQQVHEVV